MIHFRYHLISIVAVFLALGIGIVMGSTVIDKAIVKTLENRIDTAEKNSIARKVDNENLRRTIKNQDSQATVLAGHSVRAYLPDQTVFVLSIGNVPEDVIVETRELLAVSGARLGGEVIFNEEFLKSDKAPLANELLEQQGVPELVNPEKNENRQTAKVLFSVLNQKAGNLSDGQVSATDVEAIFGKYNAFKLQESANSFIPVQPVSFIVLVNRTDLNNDNVKLFVKGLVDNFPTTIGFNGNETDSPTRSNAIKLFETELPNWMMVDNAESPSGRAALVIAHSKAIAGQRDIYGVSSKASGPAPELAGP